MFLDIYYLLGNKKYSKEEVTSLIAKELANEKIVGWFQGKMEFGPRALGGRPILADPRSEKMQKELNLKTMSLWGIF